jgi:hypothetical protein
VVVRHHAQKARSRIRENADLLADFFRTTQR